MYNDVFGVINDLLVTRLGLLETKIAWLANPATGAAGDYCGGCLEDHAVYGAAAAGGLAGDPRRYL